MKITQAVTALSALAQESRLKVFRMLVKVGPKGLPAGQIAEKLKLPPATLSFHLKELAHAGLLQSHKEGRSVIYVMNVKGINGLMGFLIEDCCQGRRDLCLEACCDDLENVKLSAKRQTSRKVASRKVASRKVASRKVASRKVARG